MKKIIPKKVCQYAPWFFSIGVHGVFGWSQWRPICLGWLIYLLSAVCAVYRNRIVLNNIDKLQNINGGINGMLTIGFEMFHYVDGAIAKLWMWSARKSLLGIGSSRCHAKSSQCLMIPNDIELIFTKEDSMIVC